MYQRPRRSRLALESLRLSEVVERSEMDVGMSCLLPEAPQRECESSWTAIPPVDDVDAARVDIVGEFGWMNRPIRMDQPLVWVSKAAEELVEGVGSVGDH